MDISSEIDTLVKKLVHCLGRTQPARCAAQHARGGAGQTGLEGDDLFVETDKISREINRARHAQTGPARTDASTSRSCCIMLRVALSERRPPASVARARSYSFLSDLLEQFSHFKRVVVMVPSQKWHLGCLTSGVTNGCLTTKYAIAIRLAVA